SPRPWRAYAGGFGLLGRSQRAPRLRWQELAADGVEVGQGKHRLGTGQVLGESAVAHLREAPQALHNVEGMFAASSGPGASAIDLAPALAEVAVASGRASVDPVAHPLRPEGLPVGLLPIRLVAVERALLAVEQVRELPDVGLRSVRGGQAVDDA